MVFVAPRFVANVGLPASLPNKVVYFLMSLFMFGRWQHCNLAACKAWRHSYFLLFSFIILLQFSAVLLCEICEWLTSDYKVVLQPLLRVNMWSPHKHYGTKPLCISGFLWSNLRPPRKEAAVAAAWPVWLCSVFKGLPVAWPRPNPGQSRLRG